MGKRTLFETPVSVAVVVIIFTVAAVSSYPHEITIRQTYKEYEQEGTVAVSSSTTSWVETTTEMETSTTSELDEGNEEVSNIGTLNSTTSKIETQTDTYEDDIPAGNYFELSMKCLRKSGISLYNLRNIVYGIIANDESVKEYLLCTLKGMGIFNTRGSFSVSASRLKQWSKRINDEDVEKFIDGCKNEIGQTPGDTAILVYKCMLRNNL